MTAAGNIHVAHGWTLAAIDRTAAWAVVSGRGQNVDYAERYAAAWHAIAEHLATATEPPTVRAMTSLAMDAIGYALADWRHHYGISTRGGNAPNAVRYWLGLAAPTPGHEDRIVDTVALAQIWSRLTDLDRQAFAALATFGTYQAAADALGLRYSTYARRIAFARCRFLTLWHEGETPSGVWRVDRRQNRLPTSRRTPFTGRKRAAA